MLKNIISSFSIAAISATSMIYAQPVLEVKSSNEIPTEILSINMHSESTSLLTSLSVAGQSGQVIESATKSTQLSIQPAATSATIIAMPTAPNTATSGSVTSLKVTVEPMVKGEEKPEPTIVPKAKIQPVTKQQTTSNSKQAVSDYDALFQKYGAEYGVSWEKLKVIAKCESGFNAAVVSKNGLYGGLYQYVASTWSGTRKQMGLDPNPELRFNAEEAIRTTAYKISKGGIGAWPVCGKK